MGETVWMNLVALAVRATDAGNFPRNARRELFWRPTRALLLISMLSAIRRALGQVSGRTSWVMTQTITLDISEHPAGLQKALYSRNCRVTGRLTSGRRRCGVVYSSIEECLADGWVDFVIG